MSRERHPNQRPRSSLPPELRRTSVPPAVRAWIERETAARIERVSRLPGASSTAVHRIDLSHGGRAVLRRYSWPGFVESEPEAPGREVDALQFAARHGLPVPRVLAADPSGTAVGDGVPVVLMTHMRGRAVGVPDLARLAEVAAAIHDLNAVDLGHEYYPWYEAEMMTPPPRSTRPQLWESAIGLWKEAMPDYEPVFIHRDFHPGNVLWSRGAASGVVDWPAACRGPAGCDVAHCRANLRGLGGPEAADRFVAAYHALTGTELHPFWVMAGILEHSHRHWTPERLREAEPDLAAAVAAIT